MYSRCRVQACMMPQPAFVMCTFLLLHIFHQANAECTCKDPALCKPILAERETEVFGFRASADDTYRHYEFSVLTTVAWNHNPDLLCKAHAHGVRVVLDGRGANGPEVYGNKTARTQYLQQQLHTALENGLDGINFDMEDPLASDDPLVHEYTAMIREATQLFHHAIPGSQVSVDVPWSPDCIDGRCFDFPGLVAAADIAFVMSYDMQSQIWGSCVASANSPVPMIEKGIQRWLDIGTDPHKVVLGLPWYGYMYPCTNLEEYAAQQGNVCVLPSVPFRGVPCSDAAGRQYCFADIMRFLRAADDATDTQSDSTAGSVQRNAQGHDRAVVEEQRSVQERNSVQDEQTSVRGVGLLERISETGMPEFVCKDSGYEPLQQGKFARCRQNTQGAPLGALQQVSEGALEGTVEGGRDRGLDGPSGGAPGGPLWDHQLWYDDAETLASRYALAHKYGLRGIGVWNLDCLDFACTDAECAAQTESMWKGFRDFVHGSESGSAAQ